MSAEETGLIERLQNAPEGSREMDAEIARFFGHTINWRPGGTFQDANGGPVVHYHAPHPYAGMVEPCPHYTASLDAARSTFPDGTAMIIDIETDGRTSVAVREAWEKSPVECRAATAPLALCLARILKAKGGGE